MNRAVPEEPAVDCDFPGGNVLLDGIEGDMVRVRQDLRDTRAGEDWFYWYFRLRGAAGRTLTFHFPRPNTIGLRGPAASMDGGRTWRWLGAEQGGGTSFKCAIEAGVAEARFSFAMPYVEADLSRFLAAHEGNPHLEPATLCRTRKGRPVELLRLARLDGRCPHRVLLTCRHHCCETTASYVLEGVMAAVLDDGEHARWLREHVGFLVLPFMDKDGVQDGDQGKNRAPYDHNRDYAGRSIYPSVRALRELVPPWSDGRLRIALDLHCPWVRDEAIQFVGTSDRDNWRRVGEFSRVLEGVRSGPLPFSRRDNLPFGQAWNTGTGSGKSFSRWAGELPGVLIANALETPYAVAGGQTVTLDSARALGRDLAAAVRRYLEAT